MSQQQSYYNNLKTNTKSLKKSQKENLSRVFEELKDLPQKILVVDKTTINIISLLFLKSNLYEHQIFDTIKITDINNITHGKKDFNPIYILSPLEENFKQLVTQIEQHVFKKLHIYFVNSISNEWVELLAKADVTKDSIVLIREIYLSFEILDSKLFTLPTGNVKYKGIIIKSAQKSKDEKKLLKKSEESQYSFFQALREIPTIYYKKKSIFCKKLAERLGIKLERDYSSNHTEFHSNKTSYLMIVDRSEDAASPLLHTWSYQSMIHEMLELDRNVVQQNLDSSEKILLEDSFDQFYKDNKLSNFGEFADSQSKHLIKSGLNRKNMSKTQTIQDLQNALDQLPEIQKESIMIQKHSKIINKIISETKNKNLYEVSAQQQEIVNGSSINKSTIIKDLTLLLNNTEIQDIEKLKLVMLYSLRYEDDTERLDMFKKSLIENTKLSVYIYLFFIYLYSLKLRMEVYLSRNCRIFMEALIEQRICLETEIFH